MNRLKTILLSLVLMGASVGCYWAWKQHLYFTLALGTLVVVGIVVGLCQMQARSARRMQRLLDSFYSNDFSLSFTVPEKSRWRLFGRSISDEDLLSQQMNEIIRLFKKEVTENQTRFRFYETLLGTVDTLVLVTTEKGTVFWMNRAAVNELCGHEVHRIDELSAVNPDLPLVLSALRPGEVRSIRVEQANRVQEMAVGLCLYESGGRMLRIFTLRNIREVLEENEMLAWQKLIRVLTHEIMNSMAPIISLSETLEDRLTASHIEDDLTLQGLQTIHRRSRGLLEFVENYRKLTRIPQPKRTEVTVQELIGPIVPLFPSTERLHYVFQLKHPDAKLFVDRSQLEQVLINLLKNATEACGDSDGGVITLSEEYNSQTQRQVLKVTDNGPGILPEVQDKIFVPFFTTKSSGSGIGLSLSKQIIRMHQGLFMVNSVPGCTVFIIEL